MDVIGGARARLALAGWVCLLVWASAALAQANPERNHDLKIATVDLRRLIRQSPQAEQAKANMAKRFAKRKARLQAESKALRAAIKRLKRDGPDMPEARRKKLQASIRERQGALETKRGKYNDEVADAQAAELKRMRREIRDVIDAYAADKGYDLILGDAALYASDSVDVTDDILARLKKR